MKKRTAIELLENSFLSIKEYIEGELTPEKIVFDTAFVDALKKETASLLNVCETLNNDVTFIQELNMKTNLTNGILFKAEHFFLADCIVLFEKKENPENKKALFTLAYYYDALRNNHFADGKAINTLNKLVQNSDFRENLKKITNQNKIVPVSGNQTNFLIQTLSETKHQKLTEIITHYENFIQLAFDENIQNDPEIKQLITPVSVAQNTNSQVSLPPIDDSLEKVLSELNELVGLENVKKDIKELINLLEIQKKRKQVELKNIDLALHTVFLGPPGTGKTTVARLLSRIFKLLGFVSKGQLYETDREGLIAGYVGQTAIKTDKVVDESIGGVLFIDEAYSLNQNAMQSDFGAEAVNTILKRMEDNRDDLAVVVAGYTEPMQLFIESNPGLRSRFNRYFHFEHFKPVELFQIFESQCKKLDFVLTEDAIDKLKETFEVLYEKRDEGFGNARVVRNLFEKCVQNQANRVIKVTNITKDVLRALVEEDIPEPKQTLDQTFYSIKEE